MYRVLINGKNFLIEWNGSLQKCGFYVTRYVDSRDVTSAEYEAISNLKNDLSLVNLTKNPLDDPPMLFIEEIVKLKEETSSSQNTGFSWYSE